MRCVPGTRTRAHARPDSARARAPSRPARARASSPRSRTVALVAALVLAPLTLLQRAAERVRHGRLLRALRDVPARSPEPRRPSRSGTRSRSRASRSPPIRSPACSTRRRSSSYGLFAPATGMVLLVTLPLPARDALVVRVRAPARRRPPRSGLRGARLRRLGLPARALAGARAADRRGLAGRLRRRGPVRRAARGARCLAARAGGRARALDPRGLAAADGSRRHRGARRAGAAAAPARARDLRRRRRRRRWASPPSRCCRGSSWSAARRRPTA